ncbi:MAG: TetR/AcrR family transcriptional regulator [Caldilinea sp.]|uniref:TetR/AcrR family transcriptional regulator n=1 Tax=Caldilinea sp. TaxID=2293560 RepID=UPI002BC0CE9E|nr:TetR/AcrR family transcriptional regulator [Anaerolineales bacterium]HQY90938.1 TetR/AcrR family transcriptional regulator [Caldilinea sp.]HRA64547.1 TetR/AcrR family transcriptional regulator [Caldilinea sp.]
MARRIMTPTPKGEDARTEILNAAWKLFITRGYASTSLRDIAKAAGNRAVGGIYNHFASKEALFTELLEMAAPVEEMRAVFAACHGETAPELIRAYLRAWLPLNQRYYEYLKLVQIDLGEFGGANIQRIFPELTTPLQEFVRSIQALPGLRPMPTVVLMRLLDAIAAGYVVTARYGPDDVRADFTPEAWIDLLIDALLNGIAQQNDEGGIELENLEMSHDNRAN